jgi:hypothetical protein
LRVTSIDSSALAILHERGPDTVPPLTVTVVLARVALAAIVTGKVADPRPCGQCVGSVDSRALSWNERHSHTATQLVT